MTSKDKDFEDLEEYIKAVAQKARELCKVAEETDDAYVEISFNPSVGSRHEDGGSFRYLPPERADLQQQNAALKAEIEQLKRVAAEKDRSGKKPKTK
jgi:hypothetical protein